jgi:hypothetical protein
MEAAGFDTADVISTHTEVKAIGAVPGVIRTLASIRYGASLIAVFLRL